MSQESVESWRRNLPSAYIPWPLEIEPARLAYRRYGQTPMDLESSGERPNNPGLLRKPTALSEPERNSVWPSTGQSTPPSLPPRESRKSRRSWLLGYNMDRPAPKRSVSDGNERFNVRHRNSVDHKDLDDFEDISLADVIVETPQPTPPDPEPPRRTLRSSINHLSTRFSLPPSEIPYPSPLFTRYNPGEDKWKPERILGIHASESPPVPPKPGRVNPSEATSNSSLDLYNKPLPPRPLPPLNGRIAWLHALTAFLAVGNCWGIGNAFGLFQAYYTRYYLAGTSPSTIAWIGSTQLALVFGLGVPVGRLVDIGYFRTMFHGGTLLMILGLFASSACSAFWSLWLTQGLLAGLGMGMVFCSGILALMSWFDERKIGIAMGLGAAGSCVGGIVYVLLARRFLAMNGFATTMRILGAVATATMIPPNLVFRMRDQTHLSKPTRSKTPSSQQKTPLSWRTLASPAYLSAAAGMFLTFLGVYFGFVYMISFGSEILHLSDTASANLLIFMLAANLPGRFLPALVSDNCIGPLNTLIPCTFLSSAVIWLWVASSAHPNRASLTVVACFYGFVSAGVQVLCAPTVYTFCLEPASESSNGETAKLATDKMGVKAGGIFSCVGIACLVGTPIGGALVSARVDRGLEQPYLGAQVFSGACLCLGAGFLLGSRVAKVGWEARRA